MKSDKCELRVLGQTQAEAEAFTQAVNAGVTTQHLFTGSIPMRPIDILEVWKREKEAGSIEFGIWANHCEDCVEYAFVGTCGLYGAGKPREIYQLWEFRILIFNAFCLGKGIGTQAARLVVNYGFNRLNAHRIWLGVNEDNVGAIKCYEKVGFRHEGVKRKELYCHGQWRDAVQMGLLKDEWTYISMVAGK